jgi:hypothetical protein
VHLTDRGDGQRLALKRGEQLVQRLAQLVLDRGDDLLNGRWWDALAQQAQLGDVLGRQQVVAGREDLTQLDGGCPKLLKRQPQVARLADRLVVAAPEAEAPEDRHLVQSELLHQPAQPVARDRPGDLPVAMMMSQDHGCQKRPALQGVRSSSRFGSMRTRRIAPSAAAGW